MASFSYKAKKGLNDIVEGFVDAEDQSGALLKIEQLGLVPVSVNHAGRDQAALRAKTARPARKRPVSSADVLDFIKKLTTLSRAQVELLSSLRILHEQTANPEFQAMILEIYNMTKEGNPFSLSLSKFPKAFSPLSISLIKAGEASGKLSVVLEQISEFMSREEGLRNKVRVALAYPVLLSGVGLVSVFVLLNFVVPKLRPILEGMGKDLPWFTLCILQVSAFVNKSWAIGLVVLAAAALAIHLFKGKEMAFKVLGKALDLIPVVRRLAVNQELTYFTQALALLLKGGISALKAFEIAAETVTALSLRQELAAACRNIASGEGIARSLRAYTSLPDFLIRMVAVGEESGRLVDVLEEIAASYRRQIETDIAIVSALLEPVLILVIGLIMGAIVIAILLPTFQITQFIR
jgi:type II secretory pathway component PulF